MHSCVLVKVLSCKKQTYKYSEICYISNYCELELKSQAEIHGVRGEYGPLFQQKIHAHLHKSRKQKQEVWEENLNVAQRLFIPK
jgi:hypothetical protein